MKSSLPKKRVRKAAKTSVSPGRIIEMRPVPTKKPFTPGLFVLALVAVGSLAACAFAFQKLGVVLSYADAAHEALAKTGAENAELKSRVTDLETLDALAKKAAPTELPADIVWAEYASKNISFRYPEGYEIVKATASFPALTVKSGKGRIEIFRMRDFGERPWGFEDQEITQADIDENVPKEFKMASEDLANSKVQPYDVWIYYGEGDGQAKAIFDAIAASIKVLR